MEMAKAGNAGSTGSLITRKMDTGANVLGQTRNILYSENGNIVNSALFAPQEVIVTANTHVIADFIINESAAAALVVVEHKVCIVISCAGIFRLLICTPGMNHTAGH